MRRATIAGAALVISGTLAATPAAMASDADDARAAVDQWFVVLNAMLNGDPKPFADLYSHADGLDYWEVAFGGAAATNSN